MLLRFRDAFYCFTCLLWYFFYYSVASISCFFLLLHLVRFERYSRGGEGDYANNDATCQQMQSLFSARKKAHFMSIIADGHPLLSFGINPSRDENIPASPSVTVLGHAWRRKCESQQSPPVLRLATQIDNTRPSVRFSAPLSP